MENYIYICIHVSCRILFKGMIIVVIWHLLMHDLFLVNMFLHPLSSIFNQNQLTGNNYVA